MEDAGGGSEGGAGVGGGGGGGRVGGDAGYVLGQVGGVFGFGLGWVRWNGMAGSGGTGVLSRVGEVLCALAHTPG